MGCFTGEDEREHDLEEQIQPKEKMMQCDAQYKDGETGHIVHCTLDAGHDSNHTDARGNWKPGEKILAPPVKTAGDIEAEEAAAIAAAEDAATD